MGLSIPLMDQIGQISTSSCYPCSVQRVQTSALNIRTNRWIKILQKNVVWTFIEKRGSPAAVEFCFLISYSASCFFKDISFHGVEINAHWNFPKILLKPKLDSNFRVS